jgi:hypothetical protein
VESLANVGERLLLAYQYARTFVDSRQQLHPVKGLNVIDKLVSSLASFSIALRMEQTQFTRPAIYRGYVSIAGKLGIDFKHNPESQEWLESPEAARLTEDALRCSWKLATACFWRRASKNDSGEGWSLEYSLSAPTVNQILLGIQFNQLDPDSADCVEITRLLTAALAIPEMRGTIDGAYIDDFLRSILQSSTIMRHVKAESAVEIAAAAVQMPERTSSDDLYRLAKREFLKYRVTTSRPVIRRDADLTPLCPVDRGAALETLSEALRRFSPSHNQGSHLKGGIG